MSLFTPMKVANGPLSGSEVSGRRVTTGEFEDGEKFVLEDNWKTAEDPHMLLPKHWRGVTTFPAGSG